MDGATAARAHWSFWIIALVALMWNVLGAINFIVQMNPDTIASYPESHRAIIEGRPAWATAAFAVTVFGGGLGCLLLLLRKAAAFHIFIASLLGVIVVMVHSIGALAAASIDLSFFEILMMILMPPVVAAFLIWYSNLARSKGWIG